MKASIKIATRLNSTTVAGVLADLDPTRFGPPGPNPLADMDLPTELSENIILNVLVEIDNTLHFSAYYSMFLIQNMRIADACELAARNDPSAPLADLDRWGPNPL